MEVETSQLAVQAGGGTVVGAVIGFAAKKVLKLVVALIGIQAGLLAYLETQGVIAVDWEAFQNLTAISPGDGGLPPYLNQLFASAPVGGGFTLGAAVGFRKG
jgi:uncharacterized membrane protein (Fun14 family)